MKKIILSIPLAFLCQISFADVLFCAGDSPASGNTSEQNAIQTVINNTIRNISEQPIKCGDPSGCISYLGPDENTCGPYPGANCEIYSVTFENSSCSKLWCGGGQCAGQPYMDPTIVKYDLPPNAPKNKKANP